MQKASRFEFQRRTPTSTATRWFNRSAYYNFPRHNRTQCFCWPRFCIYGRKNCLTINWPSWEIQFDYISLKSLENMVYNILLQRNRNMCNLKIDSVYFWGSKVYFFYWRLLSWWHVGFMYFFFILSRTNKLFFVCLFLTNATINLGLNKMFCVIYFLSERIFFSYFVYFLCLLMNKMILKKRNYLFCVPDYILISMIVCYV